MGVCEIGYSGDRWTPRSSDRDVGLDTGFFSIGEPVAGHDSAYELPCESSCGNQSAITGGAWGMKKLLLVLAVFLFFSTELLGFDAPPPQIDGNPLSWEMPAEACASLGLGISNPIDNKPILEAYYNKTKIIDGRAVNEGNREPCNKKRTMRDLRDSRNLAGHIVKYVSLHFVDNKLCGVSLFVDKNAFESFKTGLTSKYGDPKSTFGHNQFNAVVAESDKWDIGKTTITLSFKFLENSGYMNYSFMSEELLKVVKTCEGNKGEGL